MQQVHGLDEEAELNEVCGAGLILCTVAVMAFEKKILAFLDKAKSTFCCKPTQEKSKSEMTV